jgi:hypothetical protein
MVEYWTFFILGIDCEGGGREAEEFDMERGTNVMK